MAAKEIRKALEEHGLDVDKYVSILTNHEKRSIDFVGLSPSGEEGDLKRIRELSLVLRQTLLHRAIMLVRSAGLSVAHQNGYSLALSVRGHFETTASLGYLHYRLGSLKSGNISVTDVDKDLCVLLLGSRDEEILAINGADGFEAKQIMTMLEYADKSVSKSVMRGTANEHKMLMDIYKWLCEFCHPNFHSNKLAFTLDHVRNGFVFRHQGDLEHAEANILGNLLVSGPIFVHLYDEIETLVP